MQLRSHFQQIHLHPDFSETTHHRNLSGPYQQPQTTKTKKVEQFFEQLCSIVARTPKQQILVVQGDWSAKVGPVAYEQWARTVGRFGIGKTKDS